jgi:hypothetical protein
MLADRYYCTEIHEGPRSRQFCFYASTEGLNDPQYGYGISDSWIGDAYESEIEQIRKQLQAQHDATKDGVVVTVSVPVEVGLKVLVHMNPRLNVYVEDAIALAKRELGLALHPIKMTWAWEGGADRDPESLVQLQVSDETGLFGKGFTPQELKNQSLVEAQIRRLYRDLLELGSRTRVMNLLRMNAGSERE